MDESEKARLWDRDGALAPLHQALRCIYTTGLKERLITDGVCHVMMIPKGSRWQERRYYSFYKFYSLFMD